MKIMEKFEYKGIEIEWLGHASFKIKYDSKTIYIDPFVIPKEPEKADYIFVTHEHYDHCALENIGKLIKETTKIIATEDCLAKLDKFGVQVITVVPNDSKQIDEIKVETIPAYNLNKAFHTKDSGWVGYILEIKGVRIYHAGDTDATPEMKSLKNIDIALLPVGGKYTMDYKEAAEAVNEFKPKIAIPMHWGKIVGSKEDAEKFKELVKESEAIILEPSIKE